MLSGLLEMHLVSYEGIYICKTKFRVHFKGDISSIGITSLFVPSITWSVIDIDHFLNPKYLILMANDEY